MYYVKKVNIKLKADANICKIKIMQKKKCVKTRN